jgi:hypothetical protein
MSLVLIACDSAQAIAVSDGRISVPRHPRLRIDRWPKVYRLNSHLCMAATGSGTFALFWEVLRFQRRWHAGSSLDGMFGDLAAHARRVLTRWGKPKIAAAFFGWDQRIRRVRVAACHEGDLMECSQPNSSLPVQLAFGRTDGIALAPDAFAVRDPAGKMREIIAEAAARDPRVGTRTYSYLVQGPPEAVSRRGRVWPMFNPAKFEPVDLAQRIAWRNSTPR